MTHTPRWIWPTAIGAAVLLSLVVGGFVVTTPQLAGRMEKYARIQSGRVAGSDRRLLAPPSLTIDRRSTSCRL